MQGKVEEQIIMAKEPTNDEQEVIETPAEGTDTQETENQETPPVEDKKPIEEDPKVKDLKGANASLLKQVKDLRVQKQELQTQLDTPVEEPIEGEVSEVSKEVQKVLREERTGEAKANRVIALRKFQEEHPDFHPDNDLSGMKMEILNENLARFNTQNARSVDDILKFYEDALKLTMKSETPTEQVNRNPDASTPVVPGNPQKEDIRLTTEEDKLREEKGWSVEKFLEMKEKYPDVIKPFQKT